MLYKATQVEALGETRIDLASNCYSDAWPLLRRLTFRKARIDLTSQSLPLACAVLTKDYCGDLFEFPGIKIGSDYADAIGLLLGPGVNVAGVDGFSRGLSSGEFDVITSRAGTPIGAAVGRDSTPLIQVDWSGDFVDASTRSSRGFVFGTIQTNAGLFADTFSVSVALGLLAGRDRCRTLYVAEPALSRDQYEMIREALRIVGVTLDASIAQDEPMRAHPAGKPRAPVASSLPI